jgi:hypothetical protein
MLNKKMTRKEFLFTIASIIGLLALNSIPKTLREVVSKNKSVQSHTSTINNNQYGNSTYGGNA